jgi:hypothetical protein
MAATARCRSVQASADVAAIALDAGNSRIVSAITRRSRTAGRRAIFIK